MIKILEWVAPWLCPHIINIQSSEEIRNVLVQGVHLFLSHSCLKKKSMDGSDRYSCSYSDITNCILLSLRVKLLCVS